MIRLLVLLSVVPLLLACGSSKCPTVGESDVDWELESSIMDAVSSLLLDPGSYEPRRYYTTFINASSERDDGSRFYTSLMVDFTAKNMFGGRVPGQAIVELREDSEDGCIVVEAELR